MPDAERRTLTIITEPPLPQVQVLNNITLDNEPCGDWVSRLKLTAIGDSSSARLLFGGNYGLACGDKERNYSVLGHSDYVYALFTLLWRQLGGTFGGTVRDNPSLVSGRPLLSNRTQSLAEVVRDINKYSNNVMARQLFLSLGGLSYGAPASADKSRRRSGNGCPRSASTSRSSCSKTGQGFRVSSASARAAWPACWSPLIVVRSCRNSSRRCRLWQSTAL